MMVYSPQAFVLLGVFFLCIGSVITMLTYRLPIMLAREWQHECNRLGHQPSSTETTPINLFFPRSFCPHCKKTIAIWNNIPVISYIMLCGRCAQCKTTFSWRYPVIEIVCALLSLQATLLFNTPMMLLVSLCFIWIILSLCVIDLSHQLLPDSLTLSLLWLGLLANTHHAFTALSDAVYAALAGYLSLWVVLQAFQLITRREGLGRGDLKLFAALGAWFGCLMLPLILLIASILGLIFGLIYLKIGQLSHRHPIPFGPCLGIAGLACLFKGPLILHYYLSSLPQLIV
jgi:leader peptidase (prepilin peptidase)/N-methyltransferase